MSDFGSSDHYVGIVKGVIERVTDGRVRVLDLTHDVKPFSVRAGAYVLYTSYKVFPRGTVFLCVVDPGVGTKRKALVVVTNNYVFVGPDNGVLWPAASEDGILEAYSIENDNLFMKPVSNTFHGRDVFGPVAGLIAAGMDPSIVGPRLGVNELVRLELTSACQLDEEGCVHAKVNYVDHFGNVATSLREDCLPKLCDSGYVEIRVRERVFRAKCARTFGDVGIGQMLVYINSFGFIEVAVNHGSASRVLGVDVDDTITVCRG